MMDENEIDEVTEATDDPFAGLEAEERERASRMRSGFANAVSACGLSTEETMSYLGQSRSTVEKKRAGKLPMTAADGKALSGLWHRIRSGKVQDLPPGPFGMAVTMLVLSGRHVPQQTKRGRPRYVPTDATADEPS
ncbi:hypothetical protein GCM10011390_18900 [Aureimonas endophytica]|uniref:Uncharacterized protein n=1 Tax=Aureimonas endophytica TaxID=2027858 RepID=A0A917E332_9HYPH|nr:hypothetical protein [Aureimonas endophytica]GGE00292.1 hypothetical protein GCM10011390_18900 [Aureimonas endophytica]